MNKQFTQVAFILSLVVLYFFDIANPDALRQGTEGFYLLIGQEMYENQSYLTPIIHGNNHWSKPPLHFWFPMPFYKTFFDNYLLAARVSISLLSLLLTFLISLWYEKEMKRNWFEAFCFLTIPLYFFKYSRIFMMEMPLALLSTLGSLYYYSYLQRTHSKYLILSAFFAAASCLIKGPVSLFFIYAPCFLFSITKKKSFVTFLKFSILSFLLSSIWFLLSFYKYGFEFFDYFFIRENIGKFQSKNYPVTSVIQGLFIYSFPLVLLLIPTWKKISVNIRESSLLQFLILNFFFFYFIWFLPKQKSHHYAVPSIPLLLLVISYCFFELPKETKNKWFRYIKSCYQPLMLLGIILLLTTFTSLHKQLNENGTLYISGCFFILALWLTRKNETNQHLRFFKLLLPPLFIYNFLAPLFFLPLVPHKVKSHIPKGAQTKIYSDYRKPFFVEQSIHQKVVPVNLNHSDFQNLDANALVIAPKAKVMRKASKYSIIETWPIWRRGIKMGEVLSSLKASNLQKIQVEYVLAKVLESEN